MGYVGIHKKGEFNLSDLLKSIKESPDFHRAGAIATFVGVVRGEEFAIGIQALNPKTLGGFPWTDNDCMPAFDIFEQEDYSDLSEVLKEAVNRLPEIQRMVLLLRDYEGYSYQEIGEMTNLSESQVKVYIYRARIFLKKYIGKIEVLV